MAIDDRLTSAAGEIQSGLASVDAAQTDVAAANDSISSVIQTLQNLGLGGVSGTLDDAKESLSSALQHVNAVNGGSATPPPTSATQPTNVRAVLDTETGRITSTCDRYTGATTYTWYERTHTPDRPVGTTTDPIRTSSVLGQGVYTYSVVITRADGTLTNEVAAAPVAIGDGTEPTPDPTPAPVTDPQVLYALQRYADAAMNAPVPADGQVVPENTNLYLAVADDGNIARVDFTKLNGKGTTTTHAETAAPWAYAGDATTAGQIKPLLVTDSAASPQVFTVKVTLKNGTVVTTGATITVVNASAPPATTNPVSPLEYAPPTLSDPLHIDVPVGGADLKGFSGRDVVLHLPKNAPVTGGIATYGGHHVVIQGGEIQSPGRALKLQHATGDYYVEGLLIGKTDGSTTEGINFNAATNQVAGSRRVVQNCDFRPLSGSRSTNHADCIQDWSGSVGVTSIYNRLRSLRTTYQMFMWQPGSSGDELAKMVLRKIVAAHDPDENGYCIFYTGSTPRDWDEVYVYADDVAGTAIYPKSLATAAGVRIGNYAARLNAPSVLVGTPGAGYVPPVPVATA